MTFTWTAGPASGACKTQDELLTVAWAWAGKRRFIAHDARGNIVVQIDFDPRGSAAAQYAVPIVQADGARP